MRDPNRNNGPRPSRSADRSRRGFLATAAASAVGTAGCSRIENPLDGGYDRSDHEMTFELECVDPSAGEYVARLAWEWTNGDGGSTPRDAAFVYWDADKWEWVEDSAETTGAVEYDGGRSDTERRSRVRFFHYETAADAAREYAASYRISTVGNVEPTNRNVFAAYVHRTREGPIYEPDYNEGTGGTSEEAAWTRTAESSQTAATCREEGEGT